MRKLNKKLWVEQKSILGETDDKLGVFITKEQLSKRRKMLFDIRKEYLGDDKSINKIDPLVSVCIPTFNHMDFIEECLNGVLIQTTNFPYEIIICDDGSYDGTAEICRKYAEKHQDKIRLYDHNRAMTRVFDSNGIIIQVCNWFWALESARGKYIAICEGDDYWIDPYKLKKQVDFLEANQDFSLCFHNSIIKYHHKKIKDKLFCDATIPEISNTYDLINKFFIPTASMVFRKSSLIIPEWLHYVYNVDYALALLISLNGKIKYISEVMSVYRKTSGGLNSKIKNSIVWIKIYEMLSYFDLYTHFNFHEEIVKRKEGLRDMIKISLSSEKSRIEKVLSFEYWQNKFRKFIFII